MWRFALDSEGELLKIAAAAPGSAIYVRLNVEDSHSLFPLSRKFGTSADEALRLLRMAPECGLRPYGLTFHVGSQCTDPVDVRPRDRALRARDAPARSVRNPNRDAQHRGRDAGDVLRAGAGHRGGRQRRSALRSPACRTAQRVLAAEPGRYLVAESSVLVATVIGVARRGADLWAYLDVGGFNGLMEALQNGRPLAVPDPDVTRR